MSDFHKEMKEMEEWRQLVGTAILSFGDIEFITLKCLAHLPSDKIFKSMSGLPFSCRVDLIIEILQSRSSLPRHAEVLINKLQRAKALSEYRNVIAHNPLLLDVYLIKANDDLRFEHAISSARSREKTIDLASLKELSAEIEDLAAELYLVLGKIVEEIEENSNVQRKSDA